MLKGVHLTLMMGPVVASAVPRHVIEALTGVTVTSQATERSGFQLMFTWAKGSRIDDELRAGFFDPLVRVIIVVTVNGSPNVIMDGLITRQEMSASSDPGGSTLTITGEDLTVAMDLTNLTGLIPYPAMPEFARVLLILAKYAIFGIIPQVIPSPYFDVELPTERTSMHRGTDLQYIKSLATRSGYVFYLEPGPTPGMSRAYWGPEIRWGAKQAPLSVNMDAHTNVESLRFGYDGTSRTQPVLFVMIPEIPCKIPIPIPVPDVGILRPPLAAKRAPVLKVDFIDETANKRPARAIAAALATAARTGDVVTGSGQLDVVRYGAPLNARQLVPVRGAGHTYDGDYYVRSVTHDIKRGEYKQSFTLVREGVGARSEVV